MSFYVMMATKKLDQQIAKQSVKHAKYESEKLKQQERLLVLQMQCKQESQAHQLWLLQLQMTASDSGGVVFNSGLPNTGPSEQPVVYPVQGPDLPDLTVNNMNDTLGAAFDFVKQLGH